MEDLRVGDLVFSRDESRPDGLVEAKPVEAVFMRFTEVVHLHVGGQLIRTTQEHPFFVHGKGWTAVADLRPADFILTDHGEWREVEEIFFTGELETVYNLRIADWHTYFVGDLGWGWAAWAHNTYEEFKDEIYRIKNNTVGVSEKKLREWHDAYAVTFTMTQHELVHEHLVNKLQIRGRKQLGKIIDAATHLEGTNGPFKTRIRNAADAAMIANVGALYSALVAAGIDDALIVYRGSIARGEKSIAHKSGYPIDWDNADIDLFIVSDKLAQIVGDRVRADMHPVIASAVDIAQNSVIASINVSGTMPLGKAVESSAYLTYSRNEFRKRLKASPFVEGGQNLLQQNPARVFSALGGITEYNNPNQFA